MSLLSLQAFDFKQLQTNVNMKLPHAVAWHTNWHTPNWPRRQPVLFKMDVTLLFVQVSETSCSINRLEGMMDSKNVSSSFQWVAGLLINSFYMYVQAAWFQTKLFISSSLYGAYVLHSSKWPHTWYAVFWCSREHAACCCAAWTVKVFWTRLKSCSYRSIK